IVIDPLFNATAKIADEHITVKPGLDGLLAAGVMKEIFRLGLEDCDFINNYSYGFSDLLELLEGITIEKVSKMTEVPMEKITMLAK
ncbi:molybdopterin-dependent oxidoreductase, partial [Pseudomonas syringae pv. tagetis]